MGYRDVPPKLSPGDIAECPSCHVRVVVRDDLGCPSCQANMLEAEDDGQRRLVVHDHQGDLPPICATCGEAAARFEVVAVREGQFDATNRVALGLLMLLLSPVLMVWVFLRGGGRTIEVAIPRCASCAKGSKLRPEHVDFEHGTMTLLVHYRLREATVHQLEA